MGWAFCQLPVMGVGGDITCPKCCVHLFPGCLTPNQLPSGEGGLYYLLDLQGLKRGGMNGGLSFSLHRLLLTSEHGGAPQARSRRLHGLGRGAQLCRRGVGGLPVRLPFPCRERLVFVPYFPLFFPVRPLALLLFPTTSAGPS